MKCFFVFVTFLVTVLADDGDGPQMNLHRRIVGGRVARRNEYPYQVAIRYRGEALAFCGGTIIDNNWVLTAAHCFCDERGYFRTASEVEVVPGTQANLADLVTLKFAVPVTKIIVHPNYNTRTKANDVALLKVSDSLIQKRNGVYSEKIEMAKGPDSFVGKTATVSGYGSTTEEGSRSNTLRSVEVEVMEHDKCREYAGFQDNLMICAGVHGGSRDAWKGDSGGPLVVKGDNGKPVLIGIASYVARYARPEYSSVYARVSNYEQLINNLMRRN